MLLTPATPRQLRRQTLLALPLTLAPGALMLWLMAHPHQNPAVAAPMRHVQIVTVVSVLAFGVAAVVTWAALQIEQFRVLCLALGFLAMGGLFTVHALATPGFIVGAPQAVTRTPEATAASGAGSAADATASVAFGGYGAMPSMPGMAYGSYASPSGMDHAAAIVGVSAFLSLLVPALFFGAASLRFVAPAGWNVPFRPVALAVTVLAALVLYALIAFAGAALFDGTPLLRHPGMDLIAATTAVLLLFAAWQQYRSYRKTRLPLQGALVIAFLLLVQAQYSMLSATLWTLAWWEYHVLMLAAVTIALAAMLYEYRRGRPVRRILEGALGLQVSLGVELENVEELALLAAATEAKDPETKGHTVRVAEVSVAIGREMGLPYPALRVLARAGLLHDIGKIRIPDAVLLKPGPLDAAEWEIMKAHPQLGLDILERVGKLRREAEILIAHHERLNGTGYPRGLSGEAIPLEARIISVADTFDALISDRPYRRGLPREKALAILQEESGMHLDPQAVQAFLRLIEAGLLPQPVDGIYRPDKAAHAA